MCLAHMRPLPVCNPPSNLSVRLNASPSATGWVLSELTMVLAPDQKHLNDLDKLMSVTVEHLEAKGSKKESVSFKKSVSCGRCGCKSFPCCTI
jgi:hypothetical protein